MGLGNFTDYRIHTTTTPTTTTSAMASEQSTGAMGLLRGGPEQDKTMGGPVAGQEEQVPEPPAPEPPGPLPSTLPTDSGEAVEDPGQERTPPQQRLRRIAERVMLPNLTPSRTEGISISSTGVPTSTPQQTQESSPMTSQKSCSTCHT
jgi:hypothetical protein